MKRILFLLLLAAPILTFGQEKPNTSATLKSILLEQLRTTHNVEDWFVPINIAVSARTDVRMLRFRIMLMAAHRGRKSAVRC